MKSSYLIAIAVSLFFILLITLGFSVNELVAITKIDTPTQPVALAASYAGYYLAVKCIILTLILYINGIFIKDYFVHLANKEEIKDKSRNLDEIVKDLKQRVKNQDDRIRAEFDLGLYGTESPLIRDPKAVTSLPNTNPIDLTFTPKLDN